MIDPGLARSNSLKVQVMDLSVLAGSEVGLLKFMGKASMQKVGEGSGLG